MKFERIQPGPGQESVWDYPRPPRLEPTVRHLQVIFAGEIIADTQRGYRILETSHPPTYYIPPEDVNQDFLVPSNHRSFCEFKGHASYVDIAVNDRKARQAVWYYANPSAPYAAIRHYLSFYASRVDACFVNGEKVLAQEGDFYGGWITREITGSSKGGPGTRGW